MAKCINDLINYYKQTEEYNEEEDDILNSMKKENSIIIKNGLDILNIFGLNYDEKKIEKIGIDEIFIEIIISLIKGRKLDDYEYTYNIFNQLDLLSIDLTKKMFDELLKVLNKKERYVNDYLILKFDDLFDEKKVNFYFFLLYFILKTPFYFYQIPFFLETKKVILQNLKLINLNQLKKINGNKNYIKKFEYIIKTLSDSEYYWNIYLNNKYIELREILNYYKKYYFESKKEDIKKIENIIKNNENDFENYYLKDYELSKKMNLRAPIINYLYQERNKEINKTEEKLIKEIKCYNEMEKMIKDNKIKKINKTEKKILFNYFKNENNKELLLKIFKQNDYELFINQAQHNSKELDEYINNGNEVMIKEPKEKENHNIDNENNNDNESNKDSGNDKKSNISQYQENKLSKKSSQTFSIINKNSISKGNIDQNLDLFAPSPLIIKDKVNIEKDDIIFNLLNKSIILFHVNAEKNVIYDNIYYGKHNIEITFDKLMKYYEAYIKMKEKKESIKNLILFINFLKQIEFEIKNCFKFNYYLKVKLEINREQINNNTDSSIFNTSCIYTFYEPIANKPKKYIEENILINGINSHSQGFHFLLYDLNSPIYEKIEYNEINLKKQVSEKNSKKQNNNNKNEDNISEYNNINNNDSKNKNISKENKCNFIDESTKIKSIFENSLIAKKASEYKIIELAKIISKSDKSEEFFEELSNSFYIGGGSQNNITLYDREYNKKIRIDDLTDWPYKIIEKNYNEKGKKITLLCCTNKDFKLINIDSQTFKTDKQAYQIPNRTITNCIEMKENNMILLGHGGASYFIDLFNKNNNLIEYRITDKTYRGGIKINDKIAALTSNRIIPRGEDKLLLYNIKSKRISNKIEGYSFTVSNNNLALIPREEIITENKILLCACKKYAKGQKNGILLVNPNISNCKRIENEFYDTYNYEVYCFCPILNIEYNDNLNINDEKFKKGIKITDTEYFFVGGFDLDKRIGIIKLFKILYGEKIWKTRIKYIQDIEIEDNEDFEYFDGPISCIQQSKITGNITVTCYNGKIYLFTQPNLNYYLRN